MTLTLALALGVYLGGVLIFATSMLQFGIPLLEASLLGLTWPVGVILRLFYTRRNQ